MADPDWVECLDCLGTGYDGNNDECRYCDGEGGTYVVTRHG
jgi:DnaJ-class molecular chaperone